MPFDKEFLTGIFEGIEDADARIEKVWKEYEADTTGLRINKDKILAESKDYKEKLEKLAQERETEKTSAQKRIEELETQVKNSGTEETKAFFEAEKKQIQDMYTAKLAETEKAIGQHKTAHDELFGKYMKVLKNTELDRAMDGIPNLDRSKGNLLRDTFWARNQFDFQPVDGEEKLLNKEFRGIEDTLKAFVATEEGKFFIIPNSTGGGAPGSGTSKPTIDNPWKDETFNLTEQSRLTKENPTLAAQLKAQAKGK